MNKATDVDSYIASFPEEVRILLEQVRESIKKSAPEAEEGMGYGMPMFKTNGRPLVYYSACKNHIGFYATPTGHSEFAGELAKYKHGKGSVQFPLSEPLPSSLISRIVKFRVKENLEKKKSK